MFHEIRCFFCVFSIHIVEIFKSHLSNPELFEPWKNQEFHSIGNILKQQKQNIFLEWIHIFVTHTFTHTQFLSFSLIFYVSYFVINKIQANFIIKKQIWVHSKTQEDKSLNIYPHPPLLVVITFLISQKQGYVLNLNVKMI